MFNLGDDHWYALERVLHYIIGTMSYEIYYLGHLAILEGYNDSNWISNVDKIYDTSGYMFTLGGGTMPWRPCKHTILTRSTMEGEPNTLDTASIYRGRMDVWAPKEVVGGWKPSIPAILMNHDNKMTIVKVKSAKNHANSIRYVKRSLKSIRSEKL